MIVHITLNNELHTAAIIQLDSRKFSLLNYTVIFSKYTYSNGAFVDYIPPNLLIRTIQSIGVSVLINKKKDSSVFCHWVMDFLLSLLIILVYVFMVCFQKSEYI